MRIFGQKSAPMNSSHSASSSSASGSKALKKSEIIDDLFNNKSKKNDRDWAVKVRLSKSSKLLAYKLQERVANFLEKNKDLSSNLQKIQLPNEQEQEFSYNRRQNLPLQVRKLKSYLNWVDILDKKNEKLDSKGGEESLEAPYMRVHKEGKSEEVRALFSDHQALQSEVKDQRRKNIPNYYYMIHPETYAFN